MSISGSDYKAIFPHLKAHERRELLALLATMPPRLCDFVEQTQAEVKALDDWQVDICNRLETLRSDRRRRILLHAPPQFGKSIIVSERLAAYLLGCNPLAKIGLITHGQQHSEDFAKAVARCMRSAEFKALFPNTDCHLPDTIQQAQFSTRARERIGTSQYSLVALGIGSPIVGKGFDYLIVDDPYAQPSDAFSELQNQALWNWWKRGVWPRVVMNPNSSVIIMFHRYHEEDFAGKLLAEGEWEYYRYAAIADDDEQYPDPIGREPGQLLSPRMSYDALEAEREQRGAAEFYGQFQGLPRPQKGGFFEPDWFDSAFVSELPKLDYWVRAYDLATSVKRRADHTAGALMGVDADGTLYLADMVRWKSEWPDTERSILETLARDNDNFKRKIPLGVEEDGIGLVAIQQLTRSPEFLATPLRKILSKGRGDKMDRARAWQSKLEGGKFKILKGPWNQAFVHECLGFHGLKGKDDQIDAVSNAVHLLHTVRGGHTQDDEPPGENTLAYYDRLAALSGGHDDSAPDEFGRW